MRAFLKGEDVQQASTVSCPECREFLEVVGGIRGPVFESGRRHFYTVQDATRNSRCGPRYGVSADFFPGVFNACGRWLVDHLDDETNPREHLESQQLPDWMPALIADVDFAAAIGRDEVVNVCAKLLDVSPATVYTQV